MALGKSLSLCARTLTLERVSEGEGGWGEAGGLGEGREGEDDEGEEDGDGEGPVAVDVRLEGGAIDELGPGEVNDGALVVLPVVEGGGEEREDLVVVIPPGALGHHLVGANGETEGVVGMPST